MNSSFISSNDLFRFFFQQPQREFKSTALGSGVIVDARKGYIITNNHVVEDMDEITVRLLDKTEYDASIIGRDPKSDLAVLQIDARGLTDLEFGDSDALRVGEWVIAVGSPFSANLSHTVTAGIVSAKGRGNIIQGDIYEDFIQTDASINQGNSGGPLFNMDGDVIGINTAIFGRQGNIGIGFSIPSNNAKKVIDQLIKYGETKRGWLGVRIQQVTKEIAQASGLNEPRGAFIGGVSEGSPAEKGGIKTADIILEFDGEKIKTMRNLPRVVANTKPNTKVTVKIWRDKKLITKRLTLGRMESAKDFKK